MLSYLLTFRQFGRAIRYAWQDPAFQFLALVAGGVLGLGTIFYHWVESWRWLDSLRKQQCLQADLHSRHPSLSSR